MGRYGRRRNYGPAKPAKVAPGAAPVLRCGDFRATMDAGQSQVEGWLSKVVCTLARAYDIRARVVRGGPAPSWWDAATREVFVNTSSPRTRNAAEAYAFTKGKLYHELAHVLYTAPLGPAAILAQVGIAPSHQACTLWNILEDGRIERRLARDLPGCAPYIRHVIRAFGAPHDAWSDLVQVVRRDVRTYRKGSPFATVDGLIGQALQAPDAFAVATIVGVILQAIGGQVAQPEPDAGNGCYRKAGPKDKQAEQAEQGPGKPSPDEDEDEDEDEQGAAGQAGQGSEDDEDEDTGSEAEPGQGDAAEDEDEQADKPADKPEPGGGHGPGDPDGELPEPDAQDEQAEAEDAREAAEDRATVLQGAREDLRAIAAEPIEPEPQRFADEDESGHAQAIARAIEQLRFDATRDHWTPSTTGGRIDPSRIAGALTGDAFRAELAPVAGFEFACAILLDVSSSMAERGGRYPQNLHEPSKMSIALPATRILYGALKLAGIEAKVVMFGSHAQALPSVPQTIEPMGGTDGEQACRYAAEALADSPAPRKLIIMVTDGGYNVQAGFLPDIETKGCYVARIRIGGDPGYGSPAAEAVHEDHDLATAEDTRALPGIMDALLVEFAARAL